MYNQFQFHGKTPIPTDALNLINHMKLHVNGKMPEDDDDRKKEQETKNFLRRRIYIQGTKIRIIVNSTIYRENQLSEFFF